MPSDEYDFRILQGFYSTCRRLKMMGSFLSRAFMMAFGYVYPAYGCFKTVEKNKPESDQLMFWCQYWILVAMLTVGERVGDAFISWLPLYSEAKLAFLIYLWHPRTKGTSYVYSSFFRPYVVRHQNEIDCGLLELKNRALIFGFLFWQKARNYSQIMFTEILQRWTNSKFEPRHSWTPGKLAGIKDDKAVASTSLGK